MKQLSKKISHLQKVIFFSGIIILIISFGLFISYQIENTKTYQKMFDKYQSTIKKKPPIISKWNTYNNVDIPIKLRIPPDFSVNVENRKVDNMPLKVEFTSPVKDNSIKSVIIEPGTYSKFESYISPHCILVETTKIYSAIAEISACISKQTDLPSFIAKLSDTDHVVFVAMYTDNNFTESDIFKYRYLLNSIKL